MFTPDPVTPDPFTVDSAVQLLRQFTCLDQTLSHPTSQTALRQAVQLVAAASDYQIFGICADSMVEGMRALESYAAALGYHPNCQIPPVEGAVYIKFNPKSSLCYADVYSGSHRGVLLSCQSADVTDVNEMFGHLPLGLFIDD